MPDLAVTEQIAKEAQEKIEREREKVVRREWEPYLLIIYHGAIEHPYWEVVYVPGSSEDTTPSFKVVYSVNTPKMPVDLWYNVIDAFGIMPGYKPGTYIKTKGVHRIWLN